MPKEITRRELLRQSSLVGAGFLMEGLGPEKPREGGKEIKETPKKEFTRGQCDYGYPES